MTVVLAVLFVAGCTSSPEEKAAASVEQGPINETLGPYVVNITAKGFTVAEKNTTSSTYSLTLAEQNTNNWLKIGLSPQKRPENKDDRYSSLMSALSDSLVSALGDLGPNQYRFVLGLFDPPSVNNWVKRVEIQDNEAFIGSHSLRRSDVDHTIVAYYPLNDTMLTAVGYFPDEPDNAWSKKSEKRIMGILNNTSVTKS